MCKLNFVGGHNDQIKTNKNKLDIIIDRSKTRWILFMSETSNASLLLQNNKIVSNSKVQLSLS